MPEARDANTIAIVGGGPAGALAAASLAQSRRRVIVFDEKLAWEKPCGGGLTHKALLHWPFLRRAAVDRNWVRECELIAPSGHRVCFPLEHPIAIFSRHALNGLLLDLAARSGAEIIQDRVVHLERRASQWQIRSNRSSWKAAYLVIAAGARNSLRKQLCQPFAPQDLMITAGYYIPGRSGVMQIQFLHGLHGYIWLFPRADHLSAGICGRMHTNRATELRNILEHSLTALGFAYKDSQFYSHVLPSLRAETLRRVPLSGEGWAMIGDAAGLVDPLTGEGLYYAMGSAELLSQALLSNEPEAYPDLLRQHFLPELELAAHMSDRFYSGRWMGKSVLERTIQFTAASESFRRLMSNLFDGTQGYLGLRRRVYRTLPAMLAQSLASWRPGTKAPIPRSRERDTEGNVSR
ncbi:MAG TPA: NAD(P)/FAD-dependent oxidoreductase [Terriglobales bacterium]|nr:NAD(P)/FAD-dependent oxidoreductase [Terriglobales bacterium]